MKFIRKALWPTAIVAAALMLFGALGNAINADTLGNVQSSTGDNVVEAGEEVAIYVVVSANADKYAAQRTAISDAVDALAVAGRDLTGTDNAAARALAVADAADDVTDALADLAKADKTFDLDATYSDVEPVEADQGTAAVEGIDYNGDGTFTDRDTAVASVVTDLSALVTTFNGAGADAIVTARDNVNDAAKALKAFPGVASPSGGIDSAAEYTIEVDGNAEITHALISATNLKAQTSGRSSVSDITPVAIDDTAAGSDLLKDFDLTAKTSVLLVVVECTSGGFDISFESDAAGGLRESASFDCQGSVAGAEISASKSTVYSAGSAKSEITVTIEDEDGTAATPGGDVDFTTNACVFGNDKNAQEVQSEADGDDTIAEATLDCSGADAGAVTVTAMIDKPGRDVLQTTTVTVIGPPASLTVTAGSMMENLTCGEVVTLTITVVDSADQPVANGTVVNLTTNVAGVLVAPATTSGGVANAYLITSNANVGSYAVVVQSGSAVGYVTVSCEAAAAPAPVEAPPITPPSTGDAGLAETSGSSWMLLAIAGVLASVMVAVGKGMPSFFRR